jgi:hypothetical protein
MMERNEMKNRMAIVSFLVFFCSSSICLDASEESFGRVFQGEVIRQGAGAKIAGIISGSGIPWEEFIRFSLGDPDLRRKSEEINKSLFTRKKCDLAAEICRTIQKKRYIAQQFRVRIMGTLASVIGNPKYKAAEPAGDGITLDQFLIIQGWVYAISTGEDPFGFMEDVEVTLGRVRGILPQPVRDYITRTIRAYRENEEFSRLLPLAHVSPIVVYTGQPALRPRPASSEPAELGGADEPHSRPASSEPAELGGAGDILPASHSPLVDVVSTGTEDVSPHPVPGAGPQRRKRRPAPEIREIPPVPFPPKVNMDSLKVRKRRTANNNLPSPSVPKPDIEESDDEFGGKSVSRVGNSVRSRGDGVLSSSKDQHVWYSGGAAGSDKHRKRRYFPNNDEYTGIMYRSPGLVFKKPPR